MKFFTELCRYFVQITTGILIVCAVNFLFYGSADMPGSTLWQILLSGFLTALATAIAYSFEPKSTKQFILMTAIHYIVLCIIMIFLGNSFGWLSLNFAGIIMMAISVALVYAFTMLVTYLTSKKDADDLTKALESRKRKH